MFTPCRSRTPLFLLSLALLLSGCGGARLQPGVMQLSLGRGSRYDIQRAVDQILHQAGYRIEAYRETASGLYYETGWMTRPPLPDEIRRGADLCRTRLTVEATRERENIYQVRLRAENTGRTSASGAWTSLAPTAMLRQRIGELVAEINMRIDAGVRTY